MKRYFVTASNHLCVTISAARSYERITIAELASLASHHNIPILGTEFGLEARRIGLTESSLWARCSSCLEDEIPPQDYNTWIRPLHIIENDDQIRLLAPNRFVSDCIKKSFLSQICTLLNQLQPNNPPKLVVEVGEVTSSENDQSTLLASANISRNLSVSSQGSSAGHFRFDSFVEGRSNELARAAAIQVAEKPGQLYNPLFIYGGVGLGKTHLLRAIGNLMQQRDDSAKVIYLNADSFIGEMVTSLRSNTIDRFKARYRSINALLIDDIQFFSNKERSQEELFHTINALLEGRQQIVFTSDQYPKELEGMQERLKSRFSWGLTVTVEPPDLETRIAILMAKANQSEIAISDKIAIFIAERVQSNIRDMEGALNRVVAKARFTGKNVTENFARDALQDLFAVQDRLVTIENIQRTVAEYFKIRVADLISSRRTRSIARPRQLAMVLAKELTNHSLPEIGDAFGGKDHTTVLHACRRMIELRKTNLQICEDFTNLMRRLTG